MRPRVAPVLVEGKKRHPCGWPGCTLTFSTTGHAGRHWRTTHGALKRFRCLFRNCNSRFTRQDNSLAHYREKHVEAARQRMDDLVALRAASDEADAPPLVNAGSTTAAAMMLAEAPALAQAAEDFRRGFVALNCKKAIGILDEDLLLTQGIEQVVRKIGQPYRRPPPVRIPGLPPPGTQEDDIDKKFNTSAPAPATETGVDPPLPLGVHPEPSVPMASLFAASPPETAGSEHANADVMSQTHAWSSAHPIPPIPPLRRPDDRSVLLSADTRADLRSTRPRR